MPYRSLIAQPQLSVISGEPDFELRHLETIIEPHVRVGGRLDLEILLGRLLHIQAFETTIVPKTLDLLGHTRDRGSLLMLGDWMIDARNPTVTAFFRELADQEVLPRLGVYAVRLLGCRTADTSAGRETICALADILGVEVFGTTHFLYDAHYDTGGFRAKWKFLLVGSSELGRDTAECVPRGQPCTRDLDVDALRAVRLEPATWPRRFVTPAAARTILDLVRRTDGAQMPGLLAAPSCELVWPSAEPGAVHLAHVLFDGAFLRFYPEGVDGSGVVYPTRDVRELRCVIETLPTALTG